MSTEQSDSFKEVANSPGETGNSVAMTQQATTPTPTTAPRAKNPKRVAAGKAVAERTRLAREQQKKAAAEAAVIIATRGSTPHPVSQTSQNPVSQTESEQGRAPALLSTTQWLAVGSIVVSLIGIYYKREELKAAFRKSGGTPPPKDSNNVDESQPVRRKNTPEPQLTPRVGGISPRAKQPRGVKHLD